MNKWLVFFLFCSVAAPSQDSLRTHKPFRPKILPVPTFGYAVETKWYAGAVTMLTINAGRDTSHFSLNAKLELQYTQRRQSILEAEWNWFSRQQRWFSQGRFQAKRFPDNYFGIGATTPDSNFVLYSSDRLEFYGMALKQVSHRWFAGLTAGFSIYNRVQILTGKPQYTELVNGSTAGVGLAWLKDERNNILTPSRGWYCFGSVSGYKAATSYVKAILDLRKYKTWQKRYTLSNRFVNVLNSGSPPYFDMPFLGGHYVRGYYYGRFRDRNLTALQTELRTTVWRWLGFSVFGGLASNYHSLPTNVKWNAGAGIRIRVLKDEGTNLRFDYAFGEGRNRAFYVVFGESF